MKLPIRFFLNGEAMELEVEPWTTLLEVIRTMLHLTGTKEGCGMGDCGSCIVLMDGRPVNSCLVFAVDAQEKHITTIEGLAKGDQLHPIQQSFVEHGAVQCGFCSPAMILSAKALLDFNPCPTEEEIKHALVGILCRCGSYPKIIKAITACASTKESVG